MSWITDCTLNWAHLLFVKVLKCGVIPQHIAFIMDGNRRFARKNNVRKCEGHVKGFDKLSETLQWCLELGVKEVTVYAFSIENFKRSKEEVDDLMALTRDKFKALLAEREKLMEKGLRIRIIGNISLLSDDIVKMIAEVELLTKDNSKALLNVAFAYTAQDEMTNAVNLILKGVKSKELNEADLNTSLFNNCLFTKDSPPPELLIRTSGETRLSDFLLFQSSFSYLHFTGVLWPELSAWDFLWALFKYQRAYSTLAQAMKTGNLKQPLTCNGTRFIESINKNHLNFLNNTLSCTTIS